MYRILSCSKDSYITNKYLNNSQSLSASTGLAGTIDLFKLYNVTAIPGGSSSGIELSRGLLQFDLTPLRALTGSTLDFTTSSFKCYISLTDVYGGQTLPSNFTLSIFPMARSWSEGTGFDIVTFGDVDTANFLTASTTGSVANVWALTGAASSGGLGTSGLDFYSSGNLGSGVVSFEATQTFTRGDENLYIDVSTLISGVLSNQLPDYGFRLSFTSSQETDNVTRFVKRFGSQQATDLRIRPKLVVNYNDAILDDNQNLYFDVTNSLYFYNNYRSITRNFYSGSTQITGSNSLLLTLATSRSILQLTSSFQTNFAATTSYSASVIQYLSVSFTGSQFFIGKNAQTGVYYCNFTLPVQTTLSLSNFLGPSSSLSFQQLWQSLDGTVTYATGNYLQIKPILGGNTNIEENNYVVNITNLKDFYSSGDIVRLRTFVQNYDTQVTAYSVPRLATPAVFRAMYWRLLDAFSRDIIIPFEMTNNSTLLSSDAGGMYFDLYMPDLDVNRVYELEFMIVSENRNYFILNKGFRFKVVP